MGTSCSLHSLLPIVSTAGMPVERGAAPWGSELGIDLIFFNFTRELLSHESSGRHSFALQPVGLFASKKRKVILA